MKTPDTTSAQIIAYATAALSAVVLLFKLNLTDVQQAAGIVILTAVLGAYHMWSDAKIRNGRAVLAAAMIHEQPPLTVTVGPPAEGDDRVAVNDPADLAAGATRPMAAAEAAKPKRPR